MKRPLFTTLLAAISVLSCVCCAGKLVHAEVIPLHAKTFLRFNSFAPITSESLLVTSSADSQTFNHQSLDSNNNIVYQDIDVRAVVGASLGLLSFFADINYRGPFIDRTGIYVAGIASWEDRFHLVWNLPGGSPALPAYTTLVVDAIGGGTFSSDQTAVTLNVTSGDGRYLHYLDALGEACKRRSNSAALGG